MAADPLCMLPACNACFRRSLTAGPVLASFLQRLLVGEASIYCAISLLADAPRFAVAVPELLGAAAGALIIVGLWTPATGIIVAAVQGWIVFSRPSTWCRVSWLLSGLVWQWSDPGRGPSMRVFSVGISSIRMFRQPTRSLHSNDVHCRKRL
jgi:hypothetical protein